LTEASDAKVNGRAERNTGGKVRVQVLFLQTAPLKLLRDQKRTESTAVMAVAVAVLKERAARKSRPGKRKADLRARDVI